MKKTALILIIISQLAFGQESQEPVNITSDSQVPEVEKLRVKESPQLIMVRDAQNQLLPPPELVEDSLESYKRSNNAIRQYKEPKKLISKTIPISTEPGRDAQEILVGINYGVTITFQNANGEPLFVHRHLPGIDGVIHINDGNDEGAEKQVTPFLTISNKGFVGATNLHVWLLDKPNSLSFYLKVVDPGEVYADRINFVVVDPGDTSVENTLKLDSYSALTMALNNRKPVENAVSIEFDHPGVTGWVNEGMMWIRTAERLVFPSYAPEMALSSGKLSGINVYYVPSHPIIHLIDAKGNFRKLTVRN